MKFSLRDSYSLSDSRGSYSTLPAGLATLDTSNDFVLVLVVITALGFDFTNGFHDTGNAMATSIATKALEPRVAVALSGVLNLVGAFLSLTVAATIASGLVDTNLVTLTVVFAGPGRRHHLEPADLAARHPVQLVARADRRRHRLDAWPPPAGTRSSGTTWSPR